MTENLRSRIYSGRLYHRREQPRMHCFAYELFYFLVDLDELEELDCGSIWFGYERRAIFSILNRDHGYGDARAMKACYERLLADKNIDTAGLRYQLLTLPRTFGYVFNPISVVYCRDPNGQLAAIIYEVNSTFGERIHYVFELPKTPEPHHYEHRCAKHMHVSPFFDVAGHYDFRITSPGDKLHLTINYDDHQGGGLRTGLSARRRAFTIKELRRLAMRIPWITAKVIGAIHYEALKLWWKKVPLKTRAKQAQLQLPLRN
ncbi:MAG: DUF1365 domain-containing protein [Pseudomonadota bacterium]